MNRHEWEDLPSPVRREVKTKCGPVVKAESATVGANSDFSATLYTAKKVFFCKGATVANDKVRMHRREALVNEWLPRLAPRLLWRVEMDGWLLLGFEYAAGHHADLSPGSPDLPFIADALATMARELTPCPPIVVPALAGQWARFVPWRRTAHEPPADLDPWARENLSTLVEWESRAVDLVAGASLIHTDLHSLNILVRDEARVIDWAWSRQGPPWVDTAFFTIRLIDAGHTIKDAQGWANAISVWDGVPDEARTAFAVAVTGLWEHRTREEPQPFRVKLTSAARKLAQYLLEQS